MNCWSSVLTASVFPLGIMLPMTSVNSFSPSSDLMSTTDDAEPVEELREGSKGLSMNVMAENGNVSGNGADSVSMTGCAVSANVFRGICSGNRGS